LYYRRWSEIDCDHHLPTDKQETTTTTPVITAETISEEQISSILSNAAPPQKTGKEEEQDEDGDADADESNLFLIACSAVFVFYSNFFLPFRMVLVQPQKISSPSYEVLG
jgi:hypothetical protein